MIDTTTLPVVVPGQTLEVGQRFTVVGEGFEQWPDEIVVGYNAEHVLTEELPTYRLMKLVSKTNTRMVFEVLVGRQNNYDHVYSYFATGFEVPRQMLLYDEV